MRRNKNSKVARIVSLIILIAVAGFMALRISRHYLLTSRLFAVKTVLYTGALKPLLANDFFTLKGRNLFSVDIKHLEKDIKLSYPYLTKIRVSRIPPDKIWFDAQERFAIAKVNLAGKVFLCDQEAAILPVNTKAANFVLITGVDAEANKIRLGEVYDSPKLKIAISLLNEVKSVDTLQIASLTRVDVAKANEMFFSLNNGIKVIIGNEHLGDRLKILNLVLNNLKTSLGTIGYIDLRFQEPAIGKR
ncbi:MAG: cell division protein FtsQ/DivIB [Candidatus Omnitrophota bacterium]|nr:cell division protein FtsQ/DivIB [Candidatus Omnitrophota bacterium]